MYLTYAEYETLGGSLDTAAFENLEFKAEGIVNRYTLNRLVNETVIPSAVKRVIFNLIDIADKQAKSLDADKKTVASRSNDGVSESYSIMSPDAIYQTLANQVKDIVMDGLKGVRNSKGRKLLYRGFYPNE